jgi:hypothetical protein
MKSFTTIFQEEKTGDCFVQPSVMGPVSWTQFGEPILVRADEFETKIGQVVLETLRQFNKEKFDSARARRRTADENRDFVKRHRSVSVTLQETGEALIRPLHREKGGYVGYDSEAIELSTDQINGKLSEAIRKAFQLAT